MRYAFLDGKIVGHRLEYSGAYHCNLRCRGCSHMSPFVAKGFPRLDSFEADLGRLREVYRAKRIQVVGGEPLLNPEIVDLLKIARRSGIAPRVTLTTNGLLLPRMKDEFWESVTSLVITVYPSIRLPGKTVETIKAKAAESGTPITWRMRECFRTTIVTEPHRADWTTEMIYKTCRNAHKYQCHMLHEGRLFKCAMPAFLPDYLDALNRDGGKREGYDPAADAFSIHDASNLYEDLKDFLTGAKSLEACRYCLGYVGRKMDHGQLDPGVLEHPASEPVTRATALSRSRLASESLRYCGRRLVEKLTGRPKW